MVTVNPGESIQTAIDSLPIEGGIVELASGNHTPTSSINVVSRNNITITGTGVNREDTKIVFNGYYPSFDIFNIRESNNITIKNLYIYSTATGSRDGRGFYMLHTDSLKISNVKVENLNSAIRMYAGGYGYQPSIYWNTNMIIENSYFRYFDSGFFIHNLYNSIIRNNEIGSVGGWFCIDFNTGNSDNIVENNTVYNSINSGIKLYSSNRNITVRNNTVYNNNNYGILLLQGAHNSTITGNIVYGNKWSGIGVTSYNTLSPSNYSIIKNNKVYNNSRYGIYIGIYEIGQTDFGNGGTSFIESNTVYNNGYDGVHLNYPSFTVTGKNNIITNNSGYGINILQSTFNESYNDVWNNTLGSYNGITKGIGSISVEPLFADATNNDFHLKSLYGRWTSTGWVIDTEHSLCIDAGDPVDDASNEPDTNTIRIDMGCYGNTPEASLSGGILPCPTPICTFDIIQT